MRISSSFPRRELNSAMYMIHAYYSTLHSMWAMDGWTDISSAVRTAFCWVHACCLLLAAVKPSGISTLTLILSRRDHTIQSTMCSVPNHNLNLPRAENTTQPHVLGDIGSSLTYYLRIQYEYHIHHIHHHHNLDYRLIPRLQ